ncbi:MAG: beta-galactosidase [Victivallales bacterium]|nr:beta-galactosidase [Victivallales bacterium]
MTGQEFNHDWQTHKSNNFKKIGQLKHVTSDSIKNSGVSIGFECLDRFLFDPEKCYDKLAAIGVKWARCQTGWCRCEKEKNVYDFRWLDTVVDNLLKRGIQPWFNLGYGNKLYMPDAYGDAAVGHVPLYYGDEALQAWEKYVAALAEHFSDRVNFWEIWNEPNVKSFWQPMEPSPMDYAKLIRITAPIIRNYVPGAKIGACQNCVFSPSYTPAFIKSGIADTIDIFSVHIYRIQPESKNVYNELETLRRMLDENGGSHVKIYQGESGYASWFPENHWMNTYFLESETNQAKWLLRRFLSDFGAGLELSCFFQVADMEKPYQKGFDEIKLPARYGILNGNNYTPKKSYYALAHIATVFDCDTKRLPSYINISSDVDMPKSERLSRLFNVSFMTHSFIRNNRPMYFYYLPEDIQLDWPGLSNMDISLFPAEHNTGISNPVAVDMLDGSIYKIENFETTGEYVSQLRGMPIKDYPILITDINALAGRIEN